MSYVYWYTYVWNDDFFYTANVDPIPVSTKVISGIDVQDNASIQKLVKDLGEGNLRHGPSIAGCRMMNHQKMGGGYLSQTCKHGGR